MEPRRYPPLPPRRHFVRRVLRSAAAATGLILGSLLIGILGYHVFGHLSWLDSLVNAAMILTGMGPVDPIPTVGGKLFESFYALFSGVAFLTCVAVLLAPVVQRFLHRFNLDALSDPGAHRK